jgi:hypothetical protein
MARDDRPFRDVGSDKNYKPFSDMTKKSGRSFPDSAKSSSCLVALLLLPVLLLVAVIRRIRDGTG